MEEYPWVKNYDDGVPPTLQPYPARTMVDILDESARTRPYRAFIYFPGGRILYEDFVKISDALAAAFVDIGIVRNDRVILLLPNCPQMLLGLFAIWKAGAIAVPINPYHTEHELKLIFNEVQAAAVITLTTLYAAVKNIQSETAVKTIIVTETDEYVTPFTRFIKSVFGNREAAGFSGLEDGDYLFHRLARKYGRRQRPGIQISPSDPAVILFSGGMTGVPVGAVGTHQAIVMSALQIQAWLRPVLEEWDDRFLLPLPLYHDFGCVGALGTALVNHSSCILIPDPRNMTEVVKSIGKYRPAFMPAVSTFLVNMMRHPLITSGKVSCESIKVCVSGAIPLRPDLRRQFEKLIGGRLIEGYAMTETMQAAALLPVIRPAREGSVGLPLPDVVMRIMDGETGLIEMKPGQLGEVCVKAPNLMQGYWNRPEETAGVLRDGWLYTGDIGYMDEDGFLYIHSRKKEIIKTSGFQVWPREIEEVLQEHPDVMEVGVAGIPDPCQGESIKAWVVLSSDASCDAEDLRDFCRSKLAAYKVPRYIEIRDKLPRSPVGKILRRVLIEQEQGGNFNDRK